MVFAGVWAIDNNSGIGKWPKIYLFSQLKERQLYEAFKIDEIVHVYLIFGESADETIDLLHAVYESLLFFEIFFEKVDQFLEILLRTLEKNVWTILRKILLENSFQRPASLSKVDMEWDLKNLFIGSTVDQSPDTALKDLLSLFAAVFWRIYLILQNRVNFNLIQCVHFLKRGNAIDVLMFFSISVNEIFLVEAQLPKTCLKLAKFILICMVKAKSTIFLLHQTQLHDWLLIYLLQLPHELAVKLQMHTLSDPVLYAKFGVYVLESDLLVRGLPLLLVVSVKGDVVQPVLLALRGLSVFVEKLDIGVVTVVLNWVKIKTFLSTFLTIPRHVKPANKPFGKVLRQFFKPLLLHLPHLHLVFLTVLTNSRDFFAHNCFVSTNEVDRTRGKGRHDYVDLGIPSNVGQISHEISKFAESLRFFKPQLAKPSAEHADCKIYVRTNGLDIVDQLVPLLTVHYLTNAGSNCFIFFELFQSQLGYSCLFVSLWELVVVEPKVIKVFYHKQGSLVKIALLQKLPLPSLFLSHRPIHLRDMLVLLRLKIQLREIMCELTVLWLHDA